MSTSRAPKALFALIPQLAREIFPSDVIERLRQRVDVDLNRNLLTMGPSALADADILLTGWDCPPLDRALLSHAPRLRAVIHAAGSVKSHVTDAVFDAGITVSSAAEANARPVAEYTVAAIVLAAKRAFTQSRLLAAGGNGEPPQPGEDSGVCGLTVGIIGASRTGRLVARMLREYEVEVLVSDPFLDEAGARDLPARRVDLDALCRTADVVTLHAPALPETRHLMDEGRLKLLRDGALLVNTSRGSLVDTAALTARCATGLLDAVLDVTDPEPLPADHPLRALPNVTLTPHIAGSRGRELRRLGAFAAAEVERLLAGQPLLGRVTAAELGRIA